MAWILTIDVAADQTADICDQLWDVGSTGIAERTVPAQHSRQLLAGFETEEAADAAKAMLGGIVAPVDPSAWTGPEPGAITIADRRLTVDAGQSFGHGSHPTTMLCLRALEAHVRPGHAVLDVGCGSGVLALAARVLGAETVTAIDIDPAAVAATRANAAANEVEIEIVHGELAALDRHYDIVVANMLLTEVEPLAADIVRLAGELLIVSGALVDQASRWTPMFPDGELVDEATEGDWIGRTYRFDSERGATS